MKITGNESEITLLKEIGARIKQHRIALNITQAELAEKCGLSSSTVVRIESGVDAKFSNYIKILRNLGLAQNMDMLIPEKKPSFKELYEQKPQRQRVSAKSADKKSEWVWGEDR
ncbi:MAG: helix-turn-helix domain-containing protein [Clostridia bacterium]|nr:helix-turn-helix domain-containing protein [Clostridia bacterium]